MALFRKKGRTAMAKGLCFYRDLTEIAERRIRELIAHADMAERRADAPLPQAGAYYRACALTVFMAWRDVTEGWQAQHDCERLAALSGAQDLRDLRAGAPGPARGTAERTRPRPRLDA
jgi:hypothetical protein